MVIGRVVSAQKQAIVNGHARRLMELADRENRPVLERPVLERLKIARFALTERVNDC